VCNSDLNCGEADFELGLIDWIRARALVRLEIRFGIELGWI
jgi:hypothetical protein